MITIFYGIWGLDNSYVGTYVDSKYITQYLTITVNILVCMYIYTYIMYVYCSSIYLKCIIYVRMYKVIALNIKS